MLDASPTSMGTPPGDVEDHARPSLSERGLGDSQGRIHSAWTTTRRYLAEQLGPGGFWAGALSTSALSTATAVSAMVQYRRAARKDDGSQPSFPSSNSTLRQLQDLHPAIDAGCQWLLKHQNADGGFGDTDKSHSNVATTLLVLAAWKMSDTADSASLRCPSDSMAIEELEIVPKASDYFAASQRAKAYLKQQGGWDALRARYGRDKTFVVPILSNCALAGMVPWQRVPALPFEAAWLPQEWYRWARMPVVSYAVPALVAIGQARFKFSPPRNPLLRLLRRQAQQPTLAVLERMQPASGGYLEATPLTSFVMMNLSAMGHVRHAVVQNSLRFILDSRLADGSWPIDTNLATWLTSLSLSAEASAAGRLSVTLHDAPSGNMKLECGQELSEPELSKPEFSQQAPSGREPQWTQLASSLEKAPTSELTLQVSARTIRWLLDCQHRNRHPFTGANPGGWGWTNLSGAVPDADDTPAALLTLAKLDLSAPELDRLEKQTLVAVHSGLHWLLRLQNRDGGWPTFCRGWG
ncbi:MAG: hypothetical protein NXI32_25615, partial [bacterium]|nr:hypothetical protein [bacterium]